MEPDEKIQAHLVSVWRESKKFFSIGGREGMLVLTDKHLTFVHKTESKINWWKNITQRQVLNLLKSKNNKDNFIFLMGADSFISLDKWKDYENIIEEFPIAVFNRNGLEDKVVNGFIGKKYEKYRLNFDSRRLWYKKNQNWIFIKNFDENVSSTEIRLKK